MPSGTELLEQALANLLSQIPDLDLHEAVERTRACLDAYHQLEERYAEALEENRQLKAAMADN